MPKRSAQLQIRLTPEQKKTLRLLADESGQGMSSYVLSRVLPDTQRRFAEILDELRDAQTERFALAELNDLLTGLGSGELRRSVEHADLSGLSPYLANYVAAMVEHAARRHEDAPPAWTRAVEPLERPRFATPLASLRPHLLRASPIPFKRRNLFVDSSLGDRV